MKMEHWYCAIVVGSDEMCVLLRIKLSCGFSSAPLSSLGVEQCRSSQNQREQNHDNGIGTNNKNDNIQSILAPGAAWTMLRCFNLSLSINPACSQTFSSKPAITSFV